MTRIHWIIWLDQWINNIDGIPLPWSGYGVEAVCAKAQEVAVAPSVFSTCLLWFRGWRWWWGWTFSDVSNNNPWVLITCSSNCGDPCQWFHSQMFTFRIGDTLCHVFIKTFLLISVELYPSFDLLFGLDGHRDWSTSSVTRCRRNLQIKVSLFARKNFTIIIIMAINPSLCKPTCLSIRSPFIMKIYPLKLKYSFCLILLSPWIIPSSSILWNWPQSRPVPTFLTFLQRSGIRIICPSQKYL